jgi:hypothetical protein
MNNTSTLIEKINANLSAKNPPGELVANQYLLQPANDSAVYIRAVAQYGYSKA